MFSIRCASGVSWTLRSSACAFISPSGARLARAAVCHWYSQTLVDFTDYSIQECAATMRWERSNAKAQTWKEQPGSVSAGARLHGHELRLRSGGGHARDDLADSIGRRTRRDLLRHRRSLWPVRQ